MGTSSFTSTTSSKASSSSRESETLIQQATNYTKEQFANSPDLALGIMHAIMDIFAAPSSMSKQALESEKVRAGLKDVLLGPANLYELLRAKGKCVLRASAAIRVQPRAVAVFIIAFSCERRSFGSDTVSARRIRKSISNGTYP